MHCVHRSTPCFQEESAFFALSPLKKGETLHIILRRKGPIRPPNIVTVEWWHYFSEQVVCTSEINGEALADPDLFKHSNLKWCFPMLRSKLKLTLMHVTQLMIDLNLSLSIHKKATESILCNFTYACTRPGHWISFNFTFTCSDPDWTVSSFLPLFTSTTFAFRPSLGTYTMSPTEGTAAPLEPGEGSKQPNHKSLNKSGIVFKDWDSTG